MKTYTELKEENSQELNNFKGMFFAFSDKQFHEGMKKIGLASEDTKLIYSIGGGGYILKEVMQDFKDMFKRHSDSIKELKKDHKSLLQALIYELENHEYCITGDVTEALEALELKESDIPAGILKKARITANACDC